MNTNLLGPPTGIAWRNVDVGSGSVCAFERDVLGTKARVALWPPNNLGPVLEAVDTELARLDLEASRFRPDSEISRIHRDGGAPHIVSVGLAEALGVALAAARWTGGLVDPTVGRALMSLGYDRDFVEVARQPDSAAPTSRPAPGWQAVRLEGRILELPERVQLDLGATAKGLGSDRAAAAAFDAAARGGVLISLGGDVAVSGEAPAGGWPIAVSEQDGAMASTQSSPAVTRPSPPCVVRLDRGALATSSTTGRQWRRGGKWLHHIVDPRTGLPTQGPWRTVSVVAATCAEANAASTAAIVAGEQAEPWLAAQGLPARLVSQDGAVRLVAGWPETRDHAVEVPAASAFGTVLESCRSRRSA
jgi:thiamine biosynthesis lipoprotein